MTVDELAMREPWCMGWLQTMVKRTCDRYGVKNPLPKSEHCLTVWRKIPKKYRLDRPQVGAGMIIDIGQEDRGHCGICITQGGKIAFSTIEGNTNEEGSREGTAVLQKIRTINKSIVGFIDLPSMIFDLVPDPSVK